MFHGPVVRSTPRAGAGGLLAPRPSSSTVFPAGVAPPATHSAPRSAGVSARGPRTPPAAPAGGRRAGARERRGTRRGDVRRSGEARPDGAGVLHTHVGRRPGFGWPILPGVSVARAGMSGAGRKQLADAAGGRKRARNKTVKSRNGAAGTDGNANAADEVTVAQVKDVHTIEAEKLEKARRTGQLIDLVDDVTPQQLAAAAEERGRKANAERERQRQRCDARDAVARSGSAPRQAEQPRAQGRAPQRPTGRRAALVGASNDVRAPSHARRPEPKRARRLPPIQPSLAAHATAMASPAGEVLSSAIAASRKHAVRNRRQDTPSEPPIRAQKRSERDGVQAGVDAARDEVMKQPLGFARHVLRRDLWRDGPDPAVRELGGEFRSHRQYTDAFSDVILEECRESLRKDLLDTVDSGKRWRVQSMRVISPGREDLGALGIHRDDSQPMLLLVELDQPFFYNQGGGTIVALHKGRITRDELESMAANASGQRGGNRRQEGAASSGGDEADHRFVYGATLGQAASFRLLPDKREVSATNKVLLEIPKVCTDGHGVAHTGANFASRGQLGLPPDALALRGDIPKGAAGDWILLEGQDMVPEKRQWEALHGMSRMDRDVVQALLLPAATVAAHAPAKTDAPPALESACTPMFLDFLESTFNATQLLAIRWAARKTILVKGSADHTAQHAHRAQLMQQGNGSSDAHALGFGGAGATVPAQGAESDKHARWPFTLIQGPPGTGKTHTVWGILNVLHWIRFQQFFKSSLARYASLAGEDERASSAPDSPSNDAVSMVSPSAKVGRGRMSRILGQLDEQQSTAELRVRRPKMLVCAPSNAACDELVNRVVQKGFMDGEGRRYDPAVARMGMGDKVSDLAKRFATGTKADTFLAISDHEKAHWRQEKAMIVERLKRDVYELTLLLRQMGHMSPIEKANPSFRHSLDKRLQDLARLDEEKYRAELELKRWIIAGEVSARSDGRQIRAKREELELSFAREAEIVFATLSGSVHHLVKDATSSLATSFDTIVIDEAAQASEVECLQPLLAGCSNVIMVGDPRQLPATVLSTHAGRLKLDRSLFQRLQQGGSPVIMLDTQYRMHPLISEYPSELFYQGKLRDGLNVLQRAPLFGPSEAVVEQAALKKSPEDGELSKPLPVLPTLRPTATARVPFSPMMFVDVAGREDRRGGASVKNVEEADAAAKLYDKLRRCTPAGTSVCVLTPYRAQLSCLKDTFVKAFGRDILNHVSVSTVDGFQGQERDVVIVSCVRAAASKRIGFLADVRRMNVAITRPKQCLLVLGNARTLEASETWGSFIAHAKERGAFAPLPELLRGADAALRATQTGMQQRAPQQVPPPAQQQQHPQPQHPPSRTQHYSQRYAPRLPAPQQPANQQQHGHQWQEVHQRQQQHHGPRHSEQDQQPRHHPPHHRG